MQLAASVVPAVEPGPVAVTRIATEPEPAAEPAPGPQAKRGRPAKATGRRAVKAARSSAAAVPSPAATPTPAAQGRRGGRPSGEQFLADLGAAGSFKALAEKYGKSVGTIGNWANQLRELGVDIPVGRLKKS